MEKEKYPPIIVNLKDNSKDFSCILSIVVEKLMRKHIKSSIRRTWMENFC